MSNPQPNQEDAELRQKLETWWAETNGTGDGLSSPKAAN